MAEFARRNIPGYKLEYGYGYYEFIQDEFFKPHGKVILVHNVSTTQALIKSLFVLYIYTIHIIFTG